MLGSCLVLSLLTLGPEIQRPSEIPPPPVDVAVDREAPSPEPEPAVAEPEQVAEPEPEQVADPVPEPAPGPEPAVEPLPPPDPLPAPQDYELPTPAPERRFHPPAPRFRGTGMLIASGLVGAGAIGVKLWSSVMVLQSLRQPDVWLGGAEAVIYPSLFYNPLFGISLGLLGGGMGMRGQWRAHVDTFGGDAPSRRFWIRPGLGWGLFGAGVGTWAITRAIGWLANMNEVQQAAFLELTYYGSLGLSTSGMALGAFGSGYRRMERFFKTPVAIAPSLGRDHAGLSISGRF